MFSEHQISIFLTIYSKPLSQTTSKMYDPLPVIGGSYAESFTVAWDDDSKLTVW